ncbi:MAG: Flp family type IVb pilin [Rhodospirillales bacterium]
MTIKSFTKRLLRDESGATAIEYGLIAALIAVAAIGGMTAVGDSLESTFNSVSNQLPAADTSSSGSTSGGDTSGGTTSSGG